MITYSQAKEQAKHPMSDLDLISYFDNSEKIHTPSGWRVSQPYSVPKEGDTVKRMVEELSAIPFERRRGPTHFKGKPVSELTAEERREMIFSMQQPSTQKALLLQKTRDPKDDHAWANRPIPKEAIINPDAKTPEEAVGPHRNISADEYELFTANRRAQKNTIGTSDLSSVDREKKERAVHGFTYSKPANPSPDEIGRLKRLKETGAVPPAEAPKQEEDKPKDQEGLLSKAVSWLQSNLPEWFWK